MRSIDTSGSGEACFLLHSRDREFGGSPCSIALTQVSFTIDTTELSLLHHTLRHVTIQGTTEDQIAKLRKTFAASLSGKVAQNVVAHSTFPDCTLNREVLQNTDHTFDVQLDDWAVTNQKSSGRCWLFALLNMLRVGTMEKMKVKQFEFSQNWLFFWDKFNRSDAFMTAMIQESDKDVGDRTVSFMLNDPISDGGQWDMAINLIRKHGLVPKYAYPSLCHRQPAIHERQVERGAVSACVTLLNQLNRAAIKDSRMADVWRLLCIHLGTAGRI